MRNMNNISELVKYAFVTLLGTLCLAGCGQDEKIGLNATDSVAPGLPTNIEVENINGELSFVILLRKMMISCVLWRLI